MPVSYTHLGSVAAAKLAVEDFNPAAHGMKVEVISADHQNKPDVGASIARQWYDVDHVDVIVDVPTSSVGLAVNEVTREKNKVFLVSGAASSDLTGPKCSPNTIHWTYDTWMLANGCLLYTSLSRSMAARTAAQRRSSSAVEIGVCRRSESCSKGCFMSFYLPSRLRGARRKLRLGRYNVMC